MFRSICRAVKTSIQKNQAEGAVLMQVLVIGWCKPSIYRQLISLLHLEKFTSRDTYNGTLFTLAHAGKSTHLLGRRRLKELHAKVKRGEDYDHETLTGGAVEARFDAEASNADPATLSAETGSLFNTVYPGMDCFMHQDLKDSSVLDVQMFDKTNRATFGFGESFISSFYPLFAEC